MMTKGDRVVAIVSYLPGVPRGTEGTVMEVSSSNGEAKVKFDNGKTLADRKEGEHIAVLRLAVI